MNRSLILALSLFALSCGPSSSNTCNATTCDGCCNGDECLLGNTSSACGTKGAICDVCDIGQACVSGRCFSSNPGGGSGSTGGGSGTTGGGSGSTGGGTATTGGGTATTGGGTATTGGGTATTGGGTATTGGGTATTGGGSGTTGGGTATTGGGTATTGGGAATTGGGSGTTGGGTATTGGGSGTTGGGTGTTGGGTGTTGGGSGNNTIAAAKQVATCSTPVQVDNAIIIAVETSSTGTSGDIRSTFWVVDQAAPANGIFVDKYYTDTPTTFVPTVGQLVSISGAYTRNEPAYINRTAYRLYLTNATACGVGSTPMNITLQGTVTVPAPQTLALTGANAQGGSAKPSPSYGSTLVTIPWPLMLTPATSTP